MGITGDESLNPRIISATCQSGQLKHCLDNPDCYYKVIVKLWGTQHPGQVNIYRALGTICGLSSWSHLKLSLYEKR